MDGAAVAGSHGRQTGGELKRRRGAGAAEGLMGHGEWQGVDGGSQACRVFLPEIQQQRWPQQGAAGGEGVAKEPHALPRRRKRLAGAWYVPGGACRGASLLQLPSALSSAMSVLFHILTLSSSRFSSCSCLSSLPPSP
ncbi:unnamed protein product [Closterium sp. NIES-64]|nr:unnamed protein product [Closterium sp. NIES-64]